MGIIKKTNGNKFWHGEGRVLTSGLFKGINKQTGMSTVEVSVEVSQEVNNRSTIWPATVLLGIHPENLYPTKKKKDLHSHR